MAGVCVLLLGVVLALSAFSPGNSDAAAREVPDVALVWFDGAGTTELHELRGEPVVLNFWASSCVPCAKEMPDIEAVHQRYAGRVRIIGVDVAETEKWGKAFAERTGITYELASDPHGEVIEAFGAIGLPTTVFIDASGTITSSTTGALRHDELVDRIERELLA